MDMYLIEAEMQGKALVTAENHGSAKLMHPNDRFVWDPANETWTDTQSIGFLSEPTDWPHVDHVTVTHIGYTVHYKVPTVIMSATKHEWSVMRQLVRYQGLT